MIAPKGLGHPVCREFVKGGSVPVLLAIEQYAISKAKEIELAYSVGVSCANS